MEAADAVIAANRRYYAAFEECDLDAMSALWERSERATCTHPGWSTLRGWGPVAASYFALFQQAAHLQFVLTEERPFVAGGTAWVSLDENLLGEAHGGVTIATLNLFVRDSDGDWRMICHHGSAVAAALVDGTEDR
ncbi:MAG TPA: nuclear transport factor 2 family protein [Acidimicrobiales bacterium]|jgi:ketosteroid isomerase-like protein|nr:nuclear transport factor 2 family protein [Acidimicrobiales bacterium]